MALVPAVCSSDDEVMALPNSSANFFVMVSAICLSLAFSLQSPASVNQALYWLVNDPAPNFWTIDFASSCVSPKTFAHGESAFCLATSRLEDFSQMAGWHPAPSGQEHFRHEAL